MKPIFAKVKKMQDGIITQLINKLLSSQSQKNSKGLEALLTENERWTSLSDYFSSLAMDYDYDNLKQDCLKILYF
jgi:hypothetical protein